MKIALATDHNGVEEKKKIIEFLSKNYEVIDMSTINTPTDDYPTFAFKVAEFVRDNEDSLGILLCGTGIGMSIAANKVNGIRAAAVSDHFSAKYTRLHNNSNVLCLGGRVIGEGTAVELADIFVDTLFEGGRHQRRVDLITEIENK